jgi:hypothetical protein
LTTLQVLNYLYKHIYVLTHEYALEESLAYISTGIHMTYLQVKDLLLLEEFAFNSPFQIHVDHQHLVLFQVQLQNPMWPIYQT